MVKMATVFIGEASLLAASASALLASAIFMLDAESSWVREAKSWALLTGFNCGCRDTGTAFPRSLPGDEEAPLLKGH